MFRHGLPDGVAPAIVVATFAVGNTVLAVNLIGDWLRDGLRPRLRNEV